MFDEEFVKKESREANLCFAGSDICILCGDCLPNEEEDLEAEAQTNYIQDAFEWRRI